MSYQLPRGKVSLNSKIYVTNIADDPTFRSKPLLRMSERIIGIGHLCYYFPYKHDNTSCIFSSFRNVCNADIYGVIVSGMRTSSVPFRFISAN